MKVNDLMIGDYLFSIIDRYDHVEKKPCRVTGIRTDGDSPLIQTDDSDVWYPVETYEPVPLTEEILEKNGFYRLITYGTEKYECGKLRINLYRKGLWLLKIDMPYNFGKTYIPFEHVHQLQHALRLCRIEKEIEL